MVKLLKVRLIERGHKEETLDPILKDCHNHLCTKYPKGLPLTESAFASPFPHPQPTTNNLFFHLPYHPKDISRTTMQEYYNTCCNSVDENGQSFSVGCHNKDGNMMSFSRFIVAYSRPKNMQDLLSPTTLSPPPNTTISSIVDGFLQTP